MRPLLRSNLEQQHGHPKSGGGTLARDTNLQSIKIKGNGQLGRHGSLYILFITTNSFAQTVPTIDLTNLLVSATKI
jgi:hypothetical protein